MTSITQSVEKLLSKKPFLFESLLLDLINIGALATTLQADVELELGKKVRKETISMSIRRYKEKMQSNPIQQIQIDKSSELSSRANLTLYILKRSTSLLAKINSFYNYLNLDEGDIFTVVHGTKSMSVLTNNRLEEVFERLIKGETIVDKNQNIGAIFLLIPPRYIEIPGFFYIITREIALANINLLGIANILSEVLVIIKEEHVPGVLEILYNMIGR